MRPCSPAIVTSPAAQQSSSSHCNRPSSPAEQSSYCNRPSRAMAAQRTDDGHGGTARSADASDSNHCETGGLYGRQALTRTPENPLRKWSRVVHAEYAAERERERSRNQGVASSPTITFGHFSRRVIEQHLLGHFSRRSDQDKVSSRQHRKLTSCSTQLLGCTETLLAATKAFGGRFHLALCGEVAPCDAAGPGRHGGGTREARRRGWLRPDKDGRAEPGVGSRESGSGIRDPGAMGKAWGRRL